MKKKLRILVAWIIVSLVFQFGGHWLLNYQLRKVMGLTAADSEPPIPVRLKATIPGSDLTNIQVSYDKDYLAYMEKGTLKIFNLRKEKIVFEKNSPSSTDKTLGVLSYQWLPDRNNLLYFYAKKNPNKERTTPSSEQKTEDPSRAEIVPQEVPPKSRYGSPQITELYSLELPDSDEDVAPVDRLNSFDPPSGSEEISAGGRLEKFVVATSTNLMYLTVTKGSTQKLMRIDVNKKVTTQSKAGELIENMAISDRFATLYMDSKVGTVQQVVAISDGERRVISNKASDRILGVRKGKVYIGEVVNNQLVKIKTTNDLKLMKEDPSLKTEWEGSIPFNEKVRSLVGADGQIVVYDNQTANIVKDGHLAEEKFQGDDNYVSADGSVLIQLIKAGISIHVELKVVLT